MRSAIIRFIEAEWLSLAFVGAAVWGAAATWTHWIMPMSAQAAQTASEITQYDSLLAQVGGESILRERLTAANDSLRKILEIEAGGMPRASDLSGMLEMIIGQARGAGIGFVSVRPQSRTRTGVLESYPVLLEFTSSFEALGRFIVNIEQQPHLARIDRLAITARSARTLEVKILLSVYLRSEGSR